MGQYTSYYLYQKYEQRDGQEPVPVYPNVWSIDGDGTMPRVVKLDDDPDCGYVPVDVIYRWINMDISIDYLCENYNKYYKQKKQVSYDSGATWQDVIPYEYQKGSLYEVNSVDCGYLYLERWVDSGTTCSGYDKYVLQIKQVSNDGGSTWTTTSDTRLGELIAKDSTDCGYVPPILDTKFSANYLNGRTYQVACNSNETLTSGETRPYDYKNYEMTSAEIGDCVTSIGNFAFEDCTSLTSVTIGNNVTSIGIFSFRDCGSLSSVTIPNSVTSIGRSAFQGCVSLASIDIPSGVTTINRAVFYSCESLSSVTIPNSVTSIGYDAFSNCFNLKRLNSDVDGVLNIPSGVTSIDHAAFLECDSITSIVIPDSVTSIGSNAFTQSDGLTSVTIGSGVTRIEDWTFLRCYSLKRLNSDDDVLNIPNGITYIGEHAFYMCSGLKNIIIPNSVTSIGGNAFLDCSGLTSITVNATTPPTLGNWAVFAHTNNCPIYVPSQSVSAYKSATNWSEYANRIQAIPN